MEVAAEELLPHDKKHGCNLLAVKSTDCRLTTQFVASYETWHCQQKIDPAIIDIRAG